MGSLAIRLVTATALFSAALGASSLARAASGDEGQRPAAAPAVGLANPASQYCVSLGGKLEIRDTPQGQVGYCHLPDGRVVEEWALFRANHPPPVPKD